MNNNSDLEKLVEHYNSMVGAADQYKVNIEGDLVNINYLHLESDDPIIPDDTPKNVYLQMRGVVRFIYRYFDIDDEKRKY